MVTSSANVSVALGLAKFIAVSWLGALPFGMKVAATALNQTLVE